MQQQRAVHGSRASTVDRHAAAIEPKGAATRSVRCCCCHLWNMRC